MKTGAENVEAAKALISDDDAAELVEKFEAAGTFARATTDVFRLLYQVLYTGKAIKDTTQNREAFAKAQLLAANLLQNAMAVGIQEGERRAMGREDLAKMMRPVE